jgi:hypothetical protein
VLGSNAASQHPAPAAGAAAGGVALAQQQQQPQQQPLAQPPLPLFTAKFSVDDEDDEEFQLDPLDWLLDDEADAAEEEALLRLVEPSLEALSDMQQQQQEQRGDDEAASLQANCRRRTRREAARRAADRIAEKQQRWLQQQQQMLYGQLPGAGTGQGLFLPPLQRQPLPQQQLQQAMQPMIPAAAAGDVSQQQQSPWQQPHMGDPHAAAVAAGGGVFDAQQQLLLQQQQQQALLGAEQPMHSLGAAAGAWGAAAAAGDFAFQQQQQVELEVQGPPVPSMLTLHAEQLQQLHHQVGLHTQLLSQLYAITAVDPSPAAQAMASSAGQMLQQIKRLHAMATGSLRGQQLGQLVQHAFAEQQHQQQLQQQLRRQRGGGHGGAGAALQPAGACLASEQWRPPFDNMQ